MLPERQIKYLYEELGARIKSQRKIKGFKQAPFAELLKISRASLVNIEKGRQHPPLHNLYEIARLLDLSLSELLPDKLEGQDIPFDIKIEKQIELEIEQSSKGNKEVEQKLKEFVTNPNAKIK